MVATLSAKKRTDLRRSVTKAYRASGQVPSILYGKNVEATPIVVDQVELLKTLRDHGRNSLIQLSIEGEQEKHQVIVHEYQTVPLRDDIIHADFFAVDMKSEIDADVPIRLVGESIGAQNGGVVSQLLHTITIRTLPLEIPDEITIDISQLNIGDSIQIKDMTGEYSKKIMNDPEETIVTILNVASEKEPAQDPEALEEKQEES